MSKAPAPLPSPIPVSAARSVPSNSVYPTAGLSAVNLVRHAHFGAGDGIGAGERYGATLAAMSRLLRAAWTHLAFEATSGIVDMGQEPRSGRAVRNSASMTTGPEGSTRSEPDKPANPRLESVIGCRGPV